MISGGVTWGFTVENIKGREKVTTYSAGVAVKATAPELARGVIAFLTRPAFKAKFAAAGLGDKAASTAAPAPRYPAAAIPDTLARVMHAPPSPRPSPSRGRGAGSVPSPRRGERARVRGRAERGERVRE